MNSLLLLLLVTFAKASPAFEGKLSLNSTDLITKGYIPRSCLDYLQYGYRVNGFYRLYDHNGQIYVVFCDLSSSEPGSAWTLVISWVTAKHKDLPNFKSKAFYDDAPINDDSPNLWIYRQTLARMKSIRIHSTHWRATCSFDPFTKETTYRDYLRGKFSDFDIMSFKGGQSCQSVEYVNILGNVGRNGTTVGFWQYSGSFFLHIDSSITSCTFIPLADPRVDYFGFYGDGVSTEFRCSQCESSTTQWWFGGYLEEH